MPLPLAALIISGSSLDQFPHGATLSIAKQRDEKSTMHCAAMQPSLIAWSPN